MLLVHLRTTVKVVDAVFPERLSVKVTLTVVVTEPVLVTVKSEPSTVMSGDW